MENGKLGELASLFLRLGLTAFGGPAAHIAMMQREVVEQRKWLTAEEFLDLLGATNFIPGPNSTEMAIHIGRQRAGFPGLVVAGACFIVPAALLTLGFAWAYVRFGHLPQANAMLYGIKPVILAVIIQALCNLGKIAVKNRWLGVLGAAAAVANALGVNELLVLALAATLYSLRPLARGDETRSHGMFWIFGALPPAAGIASISPTGIFLVFLKIGSVLFGSGYVLLAFLRADLVEHRHWLSESQLLDAVAVGQFTPGPVFSTATFVGYLIRGPSGALFATLGIFLPAFVFVMLSAPLIPKLRKSARFAQLLDGLNVASLGLMAVVTFELGRSAIVDAWTIAIALASAAILLKTRLNSAWLVIAGGALGFVLR